MRQKITDEIAILC